MEFECLPREYLLFLGPDFDYFFHYSGCPEGTHGLYCRETCSCKNGAKCNPVNGQCKCKPGYQGDNCQHSE